MNNSKKVAVRAWAIVSEDGYPITNIRSLGSEIWDVVTSHKKCAVHVAKTHGDAVDDEFKVIPVTVTFPVPKITKKKRT